jgi:hypothetical protein
MTGSFILFKKDTILYYFFCNATNCDHIPNWHKRNGCQTGLRDY